MSPQASAQSTRWATPDLTETIAAENATITAILPTLPTASPIPGIAPDQQALEQQRDLYHRAVMTAVPARVPPTEEFGALLNNPTPDPHGPISTQVAGSGAIIEFGCGLYHQTFVDTVNKWIEAVGNERIVACAGGDASDSTQGLLEVARTDAYGQQVIGTPSLYMTPIRAGAVHIVDALGERLTLQATQGNLFYFDIPSRQWVSTSGTPLPSPSPQPSPAPSVTP